MAYGVQESVRTRLWEARLDANGPAGGLEGQGGADRSSKGMHVSMAGRTGSSVRDVDGRRGRYGKEVLLLEGQGGGGEGRRVSCHHTMYIINNWKRRQ